MHIPFNKFRSIRRIEGHHFLNQKNYYFKGRINMVCESKTVLFSPMFNNMMTACGLLLSNCQSHEILFNILCHLLVDHKA